MAWPDVLHSLIEEELAPALERAGFARTRLEWRRGRPGDARSDLRLHFPSWTDPAGNKAMLLCNGDSRMTEYALTSQPWTVGTDTEQIYSFMNSGCDTWAEEVLGPLGLLDRYRREVSPTSFSVATAAIPMAPGPRERIRRLTKFSHRYRWSDPAQLRGAVRRDLEVMQVAWEVESHLMPGPILDRLVAVELDRRGLERLFVVPRPPPGLGLGE